MIYMNDICHTSKLLNFILFADDTTVFYSNSNLDTLYILLTMNLKKCVIGLSVISYP